MKRLCGAILVAMFFCGMAALHSGAEPARISHEVYVWQRNWNEPVREAVAQQGTNFSRIVVLAAQVDWQDGVSSVVRVPVDYPTLKQTGVPIGIAIRITRHPWTEPSVQSLAALIRSCTDAAAKHAVTLSEVQIDYDCAESRLIEFADGMAMLKRSVELPMVITALPAWLNRAECRTLFGRCDGFVLQVHSFEAPSANDPDFALCDPDAAMKAVRRASGLGVPFRVALPTYGYVAGFDPQGRLVGLSAEGPRPDWPPHTRLREVRSDAGAMTDLVATWKANPPPAMTGVIWYRLPTRADVLNWRWATLEAVLRGEKPRGELTVRAERQEAALYDIWVANVGSADVQMADPVMFQWNSGRILAADGLAGFTARIHQRRAEFSPAQIPPLTLLPGEGRKIGWIRFADTPEVQLETVSR